VGNKRYIAPEDAQSWERRTGETTEAFAAFQAYRDMGPERSLTKVARRLGKSKTLMDRWSSQWSWVTRAADHDHDVDRRMRQKELELLDQMRERHLGFAQALQRVAQHPINEMLNKVKRDEDPGLTPSEAARLLEQGIKLERLFRGEPDTIQSHQHSVADRRKAVRRLLEDPDAGNEIDRLARRLLGAERG